MCSSRFKMFLHAKYIWGLTGLPKLEHSLRPLFTLSATENTHHWLRVKEQTPESAMAVNDICLKNFSVYVPMNTHMYNSPHAQPLLLELLLTKDTPPPLEHLWPHFHDEKMLDMSHYTNQVQLSINWCSSVKATQNLSTKILIPHYFKQETLSLQLFCTLSKW
jgi:glutathione peroxidase-family protein